MQPRPQGAFPWSTSKARKKCPGDEVVLGVAFLSVVSHSFVLFNRSKKREARNTLERHVWLTTRCTVRFFFPTHLPAPLSAFVSRFIAWLASGIRSPRHGRGLAARISRNDEWQALAWNLLSARCSPPEFCSYAKISERSRLKGWFTTSHLSKCNWAEGKGFACPPVMSWGFRNLESWVLESGIQLKESGTLITIVIRNPRERSIQPKFPEFRSKTQWIGSVRLEKFRKNGSTFWGGPLFPVGPVWILVKSGSCPKFHWQRIQNPVSRIRNPWRGIQIPRLSWIPLHGAIS